MVGTVRGRQSTDDSKLVFKKKNRGHQQQVLVLQTEVDNGLWTVDKK